MLTRRGFMGSILALGLAPAVVKASSIMRVRPIICPWEIGFYEDVRFIESRLDGDRYMVVHPDVEVEIRAMLIAQQGWRG